MISIALETTSRCNLQCAMCGHPVMTRAKADMPWDLFVKIIDDIWHHRRPLALHQMHLMGEPLLDRDFLRRIEYLAGEGVPVVNSFSTNCTLLTPNMTDRLIDAGFCEVHAHTNMVRLCIDSMRPAVYNQLRIGGDHAAVVANARYFIEATRGKIDNVQVQRLVTDRNASETDRGFRIFGVPVRKQKVGLHHDKSRDFRVNKDTSDRRRACNLMFRNLMWVAQDGRVTMCCLDSDMRQPYGDLTTQTVREVWAGRKVQQTRFKAGDWDALPQCAVCYGNDCTGRW